MRLMGILCCFRACDFTLYHSRRLVLDLACPEQRRRRRRRGLGFLALAQKLKSLTPCQARGDGGFMVCLLVL
jgi:hypothetical protein